MKQKLKSKLKNQKLNITSADDSIFSTNGSTTSITFSVPVPSGSSIPVVIVVAKFLFPELSTALLASIAIVITPL